MADVDSLKSDVRELTKVYMSGSQEAFQAFRALTDLLLRITVLHPQGHLYLERGPNKKRGTLGGLHPTLLLNNDRFLRLSIVLELFDTADGTRMKVTKSSFCYQSDFDGKEWIVRYEYDRNPPHPHPAAHLHLNAAALDDYCPKHRPLSKIHFPTRRMPLEAMIRLLVDQFEVQCNEPEEVWRPVVTEAEVAFLKIAHEVASGPSK